MTTKKKQIWSPEAVTRIFNYSNKTNRKPTATSSNISFIYKKLLQTFRKNICLVKEFFLVNSIIGIFQRISWQVSQQLSCETPPILGIFSIILYICCCHLNVYYLTKRLWNCISASQISCSDAEACLCHCQYDSYVKNFNL